MKLNIHKISASVALAFVASIANAQYTEDLTSSFDLRDVDGHNYLSPIQNQGSLGSCYAFAATAAAESTYNMATGLYDENAANFSESYIIWYLGQFYEGFGGAGADYDYDELQALVDYGVISDADFPYTITDPGEGNYHTDAESVTFSSWHRIASYDVQTMKYIIQNIGAVDAGILATYGFNDYGSFPESDSYSEYTEVYNNIDYYASSNHAISLVGWDDSKGVNGSWILRNSWGSDWGNDGYIYLSYNSLNATTASTYLVYGEWEGEDFTIVNDEDITDSAELEIGSYTMNGIYEWGGNNASLTNNGDITVIQIAENGDAVSKGVSLWAGNNASLTNSGDLTIRCTANDGMATAYGLMSQGHSITNTGNMEIYSQGSEQANAYGIRFLSYDDTGVLNNSGHISVYTNRGTAQGIYVNDAASITNTGGIEVESYYYAMGLTADNSGDVVNEGTISSESTLNDSYGIFLSESNSLTNAGTVTATSSHNDACGLYAMNVATITNSGIITAVSSYREAYGLYARDVATITNSGTITAISENSWSQGIDTTESTVVNDGTIVGDYNDFYNCIITNNGTITANKLNTLEGCTLQGNGTYEGVFDSTNTIINPGNSVGTITIDGDAEFYDDITLNLELTNGEIDQIVVTGSLYVDGNATISVTTSGYIPAGDYSFVKAAEISYSDDTTYTFENIEVPVMYEDSTMTYDNEAVSFVINRHSYADFVTDNDLVSKMAQTLDKVRTTAEGNLATLLTSIDYMETSAEIADAVAEFFPAINYTTGYAAMQNLHRTDEYIMKHNKYMTLDGENKYSSWFNFVHNDEDVDAFNEIPGYSTKMRGYVGGIERKINDQYAAGFALATTSQTVDSSKNTDYSKIKGDQYYAYATWDQYKETRGYYVVASLGYGSLDFDTERQMGLIGSKVKSSHEAKAYTAAISAGCEYSYSKVLVRPYISVKYAKLDEDAYAEDGTQGVNLSFDEVESKSLEGSMGFSVGGKVNILGISFMPEVHIEYSKELDSSVDDIYAEFETGDGFITKARELSDETFTYGGSISARITENTMLNVAYDFIDYDSYNDEANKFSTSIQVRF
jgi:uncharacterized protein YhjY with autotransporter beta-barrel domain